MSKLEEIIKEDEEARKVIKQVKERNKKYIRLGWFTRKEADRTLKQEKIRAFVQGLMEQGYN